MVLRDYKLDLSFAEEESCVWVENYQIVMF